MKLPDDVLRDIRYRLVQGLDSRDEIFASMIDNRTEELGDDPEILVALREAIEEAFLAKKTAADSWPTVTDNDRLLAAFAALFDLTPLHPPTTTLQRWAFAKAAKPLECGASFDPTLALGVGGDWASGGRIEGSFLSGRALAAGMLERL